MPSDANSAPPLLTMSQTVGGSSPPVLDLTIGELLRRAALASPDRVALVEGARAPDVRRRWTYAELLQVSEQTARALLARFNAGDHIAVWAHNVPEWVFLELGCALAGMVLVTVNPGYQAAELKYVLTQSNAVALFLVDEHRGNPMRQIAETVRDACPDLLAIVNLSQWKGFIADGVDPRELPSVAPDDRVMLQYTSGTTGFPKGAVLHHRGLVNNAAHYFDRLGMTDGQVFCSYMPLFHTAGSVMSVLGCISRSCTNVLAPMFEPALVLELCESFQVNGMMGVPTMMVSLLEAPEFEATDLSSLTALCSGGSLVPEVLVRTFEEKLGAPFTIVYGQTETSPVSTMTTPDDSTADKSTTIGRPMPHVEVKIVDPESGETLPIGAIGEVCARGYHVMHNYYRMPEQTADTIDADGWLHSGDLGAMDARGYCSIEGRLKDMIIRGGENIYPKELEELLVAHPMVAEVAVVGLPDPKWGETVGAFIRPASGVPLDKNVLFDHMRASLAPHKTPKQWFEVEAFPLTGSGKIQKFRIRELWEEGAYQEL